MRFLLFLILIFIVTSLTTDNKDNNEFQASNNIKTIINSNNNDKLLISTDYPDLEKKSCSFDCVDIDEHEKEGEGIYFIVYSRLTQTLQKFYDEAVVSAKRIKELDDSIKIAVATNMIIPESDQDLWYKVIHIPKQHIYKGKKMAFTSQAEKQFMTRVLYLAATPFKTTLHTDATVYFCDSDAPREMLNEMKNSDVDFTMSHNKVGPYSPSGWAILLNWNSRTKLLLRDWVFEMLNSGITHQDDQSQIHLAMKKAVQANRIKARRLSGNWAYTPRCYYGNGTTKSQPCNVRVSVPLNGRVRLTHCVDHSYCLINGENNELINVTRAYARIVDNPNPTWVKSQEELDELIKPYFIPKFDWKMKEKSSTSLFWEECKNEEPFCGLS